MNTLSATNVLLYPCTLVGYGRLLLLGLALITPKLFVGQLPEPWPGISFALLISGSLLLDLLDGYLARKFDHQTYFGTLFDLVIDLITHTLIWLASGFILAPAFILLEWSAGLYIAAFSMQSHVHWKTTLIDEGPRLMQAYFQNNQRNWLSAYGNIGHVVFPLALSISIAPLWLSWLALPGLLLYEAVTFYLLFVLNKILVARAANQRQS
jgi:phosphatidylglycerophosphate synthase